MNITLAQFNPTVGAVYENAERIQSIAADAAQAGTDLVVFPEMCITGYPPKDLLTLDWFIDKAENAVESIREVSGQHPETGILIGAPVRVSGENGARRLVNAAVLLHGGEIRHIQPKTLLPVYDVFDERRYFSPADEIARYQCLRGRVE